MSAVFSPDMVHRYWLTRNLRPDDPVINVTRRDTVIAFAGVNPSTADAVINDATIRKDMGFARKMGAMEIIKVNLFGYRSTDIRGLRTAADPVGPENDGFILQALRQADVFVVCWGPTAKLPMHLRHRWKDVVAMAAQEGKVLHCLGTCQDGQPRHTLMTAYDTPLTVWTPPL